MNIVVLVGWLFLRIESATATQCLSCGPMPSSVPCFNTTNCPSGHECYAKYVMKSDGTVMYEFGCHNSQTCPGKVGTHAVIGKRATGDTELCYKCCQGDMCNQGPICAATPSSTSPSTTTSMTIGTTIPANPCSPSPCVHGSCFISSANPPTFFCLCPNGFEGVHCETVATTTISTKTYTTATTTTPTTTGLPSAGPVCFQCDQASTPSTCNTIALCGKDDVCYVEKTIDALSYGTLYKSGCLHKSQCDKHALSLIGRKRYDNTDMSGNDLQIQCCDSYLCNHGNISTNLGNPVTSGTVVPTHGSLSTNPTLCSGSPCMHGNCFSGSADYFCQCEKGWQGKNCDQRLGPCARGPCVHGNCFESSIDYVCQCENGWTGKNCDQGLGPCARAPCVHGKCFESSMDYVCQCENGWIGKNCDQNQVNDCSDLLIRSGARLSGVYTITTPITRTEIQVFCDMVTDGGGWTVFQKRFDGSESFYRNFRDYENGFGSVHAEHWLGLKYIYEITSSGSYQLRVDIVRSNGSHGYDVYENFSLQPGTNYVLNVGSRLRADGVSTTQSFTWPHGEQPAGRAFSTYDHGDSSDCASMYKGGWWYHNCYNYINLNGLYLPGRFDDRAMKYDDAFGVAASTMLFKRV